MPEVPTIVQSGLKTMSSTISIRFFGSAGSVDVLEGRAVEEPLVGDADALVHLVVRVDVHVDLGDQGGVAVELQLRLVGRVHDGGIVVAE